MLTRASILRFISSLFLLGICLPVWSQNAHKATLVAVQDTVAVKDTVALKDTMAVKEVVAPVDSVHLKAAPQVVTVKATAKEKGEKSIKKVATPKTPVYQATYISLDIWNAIAAAWNDGKFEISALVDVSLWHRLFPRFEIGMMGVHQHPDAFEYKSTGFFTKLGANYNFINYKNDRKYDHALYAGIHYAYSYTDYQLTDAHVTGDYWNENATTQGPRNYCHFGWVEFQIGARVQIYRGFFMGVSMNIKTFGHYYQSQPNYPTYIPGFGQDASATQIGFEYTLTYQIPSKSRPRAPKPPKAPKVKKAKGEGGFF